MAFYRPLPDGTIQVDTDDGRQVRTALQPPELEAMGISAAPQMPQMPAMPQMPDMRTAQNAPGSQEVARALLDAGVPLPVTTGGVMRMPDGSTAIDGNQMPQRAAAKPATVPVVPTAPAGPAAPPPNEEADELKNFVRSQIVQRSGPRRGGKVPVSEQVSRGPVASQSDLDTLAENEIGTEGMRIGQAEDIAAQRDALLDQQIARQAQREAELEKQYLTRKAIDEKLASLDQYATSKEREAAEMRTLSPTDEFFKNAGGTWARLVAGLAAALGAFGQGMSGVPNYALEIINSSIKEQAEKQREEYERAVQTGRTARNAYAEALQLYGTPERAMQALHDRGEAIADRKLALMGEKLGNQEQLQQVYAWQAQRAEARAARIAERNAMAAGQVVQNFQHVQGSGGGTSVNKDMLKLYADMVKNGAISPTDAAKLEVRLPDGRVGYARQPEQMHKLQEQIKVDNRIAEATERIRHLRAQPGAKTDPEKRKQIEGAAADLFLALKQGAGLGTLDEGSLQFRDEWIGKPTDLIDFGGADALLGEVSRAAKARINDTVRFDLHASPGGAPLVSQPQGVQSDE